MSTALIRSLACLFVFTIGMMSALGCSRESEGLQKTETPAPLRIAIAQYIHHPALDDARTGFVEEVRRLDFGPRDSLEIETANAQGEASVAQSIAEQFVQGKFDLIYALGTPMAQALARAVERHADQNQPVVFGAITDPVSAGLVQNMQRPGGNMTGTSDQWPYRQQVGLFKILVPSGRQLCTVLNPGEANTRYAIEQTRLAASELGIELVEAPVTGTSEVLEAAEAVARRCQAFYVPADNTAMAAAPAIIRVANRASIPVIAGDPATFRAGAAIGLGVSYHDLGIQAGRIAHRILASGEQPGTIPVAISGNPQLWINAAAIRGFGLSVPDSILAKADSIIQ